MNWPNVGCGVGLRSQHYSDILDQWPSMDWFEAISENYMDTEGRPIAILEKIRRRYPIGLHGVGLSIGSTDELSARYLDRLAALVRRIDPVIVSDHFCWTGVDGVNLHDLLPLPFTEEAVEWISERVERVQEKLGRRILLENISTYVTYRHSTMPEWKFITAVARRSGCGILLDLNNVYVNSVNHRFDPMDFLRAVPADLVGQIHLGGHTDKGSFLFDTHSAAVVDPVWELYRRAMEQCGPVSTLIEWDEAIPDFKRLSEEAEKARQIYRLAHVPASDASSGPPAGGGRPSAPKATKAPSLHESQRTMKERVLLRREGRSMDETLNAQGGVPGGERMEVYAEAYIARMTEALKEIFEATEHLMGIDAFTELCSRYVEAHPSGEYNLTDIGRLFPDYTSQTEYSRSLPFLRDLAYLEWGVSRAFHARWQEPMQPAVYAQWTEENWGKARLRLQEGSLVVESPWPIYNLWQSRKTPLSQLDLVLENHPQTVWVYRVGTEVRMRLIDAAEAVFLRRIQNGDSLEEVCAVLAGSSDQEPPVGNWFSALAREGAIVQAEI